MDKTILLKNKNKEEREEVGESKDSQTFLNKFYSSWEVIMFYTN
jgi:hypothetical protein